MVIDASALVAILLGEPDAGDYARAIEKDPKRLLCAINLLEVAMVVESRTEMRGAGEIDLLIYRSRIQVVQLTAERTELARVAWRRWGKGNHPAGLNLGDCCAYALSKQSGEPLLYKGNDFAQTDVAPVIRV